MSIHPRDIGDACAIPGEIYALAMHQNLEARYHVEAEKQLLKDVMEAMAGNTFIPPPETGGAE